MMDVLYVPGNILFCSHECLEEMFPDAHFFERESVDQEAYDQNHDEYVETGQQWGAICPVCQMEYHCF